MTAVKVVDASALAAILFGEPNSEDVADRLRGAPLTAPLLLGFELASVCLKKLHREPGFRVAILSQFSVWDRMGIELVEIDQRGAVLLAERIGLTTYDASYLWLARQLGVELVTLDRRLERAAAQP